MRVLRIYNFPVVFHSGVFQFFKNIFLVLNVPQSLVAFSHQVDLVIFRFLHFIENFVEILAQGSNVVLCGGRL